MKKPKEGMDLETHNPEIAKEWHPTKNGNFTPRDFSYGSNYSAFWLCPSGHTYQCPIVARVRKQRGCPYCVQRMKTSFPEQALFFYIQKVFPDAINDDKTRLDGKKELDIFIPSINTAIEYDGSVWHQESKLIRERAKYQLCKERNIKLIRVKENKEHFSESLGIADIIVPCFFANTKNKSQRLDYAIRVVLSCLGDSDLSELFSAQSFKMVLPPFDSTPTGTFPHPIDLWTSEFEPLFQKVQDALHGPKVNTDVNVARDRQRIMEQYYHKLGEHNLAKEYPNVAKEWHPTKNGALVPNQFSPVSGEKVWWLCPKGHSYQQKIAYRTKKDGGCPYCKRRYASSGDNDIFTNYPDLMKEWSWEKNKALGLDPHNILPRSDIVAYWICPKCGRIYKAAVKSRTRGHGCWECSKAIRNQSACKTVYVYDEQMHFVAEYPSLTKAAAATGVARANICRNCKYKLGKFHQGLFFTYEKLDTD